MGTHCDVRDVQTARADAAGSATGDCHVRSALGDPESKSVLKTLTVDLSMYESLKI